MGRRGRGGSPNILYAILKVLRGEQLPKGMRLKLPNKPRYTGPIVALIDKSTRSAKEVWADAFKKQKLGTLVGEPTCGAVIALGFYTLSNGATLRVPAHAAERYVIGGDKLEGNPVKPDVHVKINHRYVAGKDELLEQGINVLAAGMKSEKPKKPDTE